MYSDIFCRIYNEFGWNYYPEVFGEQLLRWLERKAIHPETALDLACGTGVLCRILRRGGLRASGMDLSEGMIRIAREADPEGNYEVADMTDYRPGCQFDLVTCTGDALNHIPKLSDVERIFQNVYQYLSPGGWFVFDILNEHEVSDSEPFEMDFSESTRVWFQMTRPGEKKVALTVRVYEKGVLALEEIIRETVHDPETVCGFLKKAGFREVRCADRLLEDHNHGTTWFVTAQKPFCPLPKSKEV